MNIGRTLVGGLSGGVIGIAAHVGLEAFAGYQVGWMAPVIGALTGIGVRSADTATGSYVRGAIAGIIALVCIVGGHLASSELIQRKFADAGKAGTPMSFPRVQKTMNEEPSQAEAELGANAPDTSAATDSPEITEPKEEVEVKDLPEAESSDGAESSDSPSEVAPKTEATDTQAEQAKPQPERSSPAPLAAAATDIGGQSEVKPKSILSSSELIWFTLGTAIAYFLGGSGGKPSTMVVQE